MKEFKIFIIVILLIIVFYLVIKNTKIKENITNIESIETIADMINKDNFKVTNIKIDNKIEGEDLIINKTFNLLPKGVIVAWFGDTAPLGWVLCDGKNGTPDLRGRFLRMASESIGTYNTEGSMILPADKLNVNYDKTIAGTSRTLLQTYMLKHKLGDYAGTDHMILTINEMPTHTHRIIGRADDQGWCATGECGFSGSDRWTDNQPTDSSRSGGKLIVETAGGNWGHNNQPPYFVINYIMKL